MKCVRCGRKLQEESQVCDFCRENQSSQEATESTIKKQRIINKRKKWILVAVILLTVFIVWKLVSPKTVESGNGWKHQIGNFNKVCEFCDDVNTTHRIHCFGGTQGYYCDDCWEKFGTVYFEKLAGKSDKKSDSGEARDAKICAVKAVEDSLKSPSTAVFCKYTEMTATSLGGNRWKVTGYVDAQNSFGAMLRRDWTVTLTLTGSGFKDETVVFD